MKIILYRNPWLFWRRPLFGLNPIAWYQLNEVHPKHLISDLSITIDGIWKPGDEGNGRTYYWDKTVVSDDDGSIIMKKNENNE